jgi:hypothetical protein
LPATLLGPKSILVKDENLRFLHSASTEWSHLWIPAKSMRE